MANIGHPVDGIRAMLCIQNSLYAPNTHTSPILFLTNHPLVLVILMYLFNKNWSINYRLNRLIL